MKKNQETKAKVEFLRTKKTLLQDKIGSLEKDIANYDIINGIVLKLEVLVKQFQPNSKSKSHEANSIKKNYESLSAELKYLSESINVLEAEK